MSEMTNDEIRPKIARAKGWRVDNASITHDNPPALDFYVDAQGEQHGPVYAWNWPEDIAAAWGLVEEMRSDNWVQMRTPFGDGPLNDGYWCGCTPKGVTGWNGEPDNWTQADTEPRAICLCYLAWKGIA